MIYDVDDDILSDNWLHLELDADEREREKSSTKSLQPPSDPAHTLIQLVFDPTRWKNELINRALPLLAVEMAKAARAQMSEVGIIPQKRGK